MVTQYPPGALVISASQVEAFDRCERLWWLTKGGPLRLKEPKRGTQEFGTALHGVIERWLKAGELGLSDAELYPTGWDIEVSKLDSALIRELFQKAVNEGVIARLPGQLIEYEFSEVIEPEKIYFTGKVDVSSLEGIQDHKSTKAMKYAKTPQGLRTNGQMLYYAMIYLMRKHERGEPMPRTIELRHNVFSKDPNDKRIKIIKAEVTPEEVVTKWNELLDEKIPKMLLVREVKEWYEIPDPPDKHESCNAYGGCTFRSLCGRTETLEQITRRLQPKPKGHTNMGLMDQIKAQRPGAAPRAPLSINPAPSVPTSLPHKAQVEAARVVEKSNIAQPPQNDVEAPPWALPNCTACGGRGLNTKGNPCRICDTSRATMNGIQSSMFVVSTNAGEVTWKAKPEWAVQLSQLGYDDPEEGTQQVTGDEEAEVEIIEAPVVKRGPGRPRKDPNAPLAMKMKVIPAPVEEKEEDVPEGAGEDGEPDEDPAYKLPEPTPKRGPGRPRKETTLDAVPDKVGFLMFLGCRRASGNGDPLWMEEIVTKFGHELAQSAKLTSFYDWDVWKRRDALAAVSPEIARRCAGKSIMVNCLTRENQQLVEALMARAKDIFVADGFSTRIQ